MDMLARGGIIGRFGTRNVNFRSRPTFWYEDVLEKPSSLLPQSPDRLKMLLFKRSGNFGSRIEGFSRRSSYQNVDLDLKCPFLVPNRPTIPPRAKMSIRFHSSDILSDSLSSTKEKCSCRSMETGALTRLYQNLKNDVAFRKSPRF